MQPGQLKQDNALTFILAGKARFTLVENAQRFTYKVAQPKDSDKIRFVSLLTGPDNWRNYTYFAYLRLENNSFTYKRSTKTRITPNAPSVQLFEKTLSHLRAKRPLPQVTIYHSGYCCKCGRLLTVPESIISGIGPECRKKMKL